jgi:hypothetical protein
VLAAYEELHQIQRQQAAIWELPIAQLTALTANINRDPDKAQPFGTEQFCFFRDQAPSDGISGSRGSGAAA